ncbi:MAG: hypothetical protein Fur0025_30870 [Oscillatoriaceae cyanobacterium]
MDASKFLQHLQQWDEPFTLGRSDRGPLFNDEAIHQDAYAQNPEMYALWSLAPLVLPSQQVRILFQLLRSSRAGMAPEMRHTLERVTTFLLKAIDPDAVLTVFLSLRRVRANHKHATKAILDYILNHPHSLELALSRRPAVVDSLEHASGKNPTRASAKMLLGTKPAQETYLHRHFLKFGRDGEVVKSLFGYLYGEERYGGNGDYRGEYQRYSALLQARVERPATITATNRGDISATLVHIYRGGSSPELQVGLDNYVMKAAKELPRFDGKVALVLDASASTRGYGQREFCNISQSVALQLLLEQCCTSLEVVNVGGAGPIPQPEGTTDLAGALISALEGEPDLVAIASDGYENLYPGDLARVAATLPQLGIHTPVVFCHSKFTGSDDLSQRRPAPHLPQLEFWHENDFENLLVTLFAMAKPQLSEPGLRQFFLAKLERLLAIG